MPLLFKVRALISFLFFIAVILHLSPRRPINQEQNLNLLLVLVLVVVVVNRKQLLLAQAVERLGKYQSGSKWVSDQSPTCKALYFKFNSLIPI